MPNILEIWVPSVAVGRLVQTSLVYMKIKIKAMKYCPDHSMATPTLCEWGGGGVGALELIQ